MSDIILILAGALIVLFLARELVCWYYKLNEIVRLLKKIAGETEDEPAKDATSVPPSTSRPQ